MRDLSPAGGEAGAGAAADRETGGGEGLRPGAGRDPSPGGDAVDQGPGPSHDQEVFGREDPGQAQNRDPGVEIAINHVQEASQRDARRPNQEKGPPAKRNLDQGTDPEPNLGPRRKRIPSLNPEVGLAHN